MLHQQPARVDRRRRLRVPPHGRRPSRVGDRSHRARYRCAFGAFVHTGMALPAPAVARHLVAACHRIARQPGRACNRPPAGIQRARCPRLVQRTHDAPVARARAVLEVAVAARIGRVAHFVGDLVHRLVAVVAVGDRKLGTLLDVHHERHRDARAVRPAGIRQARAIAQEVAFHPYPRQLDRQRPMVDGAEKIDTGSVSAEARQERRDRPRRAISQTGPSVLGVSHGTCRTLRTRCPPACRHHRAGARRAAAAHAAGCGIRAGRHRSGAGAGNAGRGARPGSRTRAVHAAATARQRVLHGVARLSRRPADHPAARDRCRGVHHAGGRRRRTLDGARIALGRMLRARCHRLAARRGRRQGRAARSATPAPHRRPAGGRKPRQRCIRSGAVPHRRRRRADRHVQRRFRRGQLHHAFGGGRPGGTRVRRPRVAAAEATARANLEHHRQRPGGLGLVYRCRGDPRVRRSFHRRMRPGDGMAAARHPDRGHAHAGARGMAGSGVRSRIVWCSS